MGRRWVESSANQAPLERVLESIVLCGGSTHGKLILVRGEAGAGASAFASRLNLLLLRRSIRTIYAPRSPFNADFLFSSHLLKALRLPSSSSYTGSGRRVIRHYEAAMHLRRYQAVICEDAHDFFHKYLMKVENTYDAIYQLTQPPYGHCVVFCGLSDALTVIGRRAADMNIEVEYFDLMPMSCDQSYVAFVSDIAKAVLPLRNPESRVNPFLLPFAVTIQPSNNVTANESRAAQVLALILSAPPPSPTESELAAEQTQLGAGSFLALNPSPVTAQGLDVRILHAHTKGLVGNTVSVLKGLMVLIPKHETSTHPNQLAPGASAAALEAPEAQGTNGAVNGTGSMFTCASVLKGRPGDTQCSLSFPLVEQPVAVNHSVVGRDEQGQIDVQLELCLEAQLVATEFVCMQAIVNTDETTGHYAANPMSVPSTAFENCSPSRRASQRARFSPGSPFFGYLLPVHDETLGSWLSRNATSISVTSIHDGFLAWCAGLLQPTAKPSTSYSPDGLNDAWHHQMAPPGADDPGDRSPWSPEVLLGDPRAHEGMEAKSYEYDDLYRTEGFLQAFPSSLGTHLAGRFELPANIIGPQDNRRFCAQCMADDVSAMRAPGLRRAWRDRGAALCVAHRQPVLLQQLETGHLSTLTGAWQAFMQQTLRGHFDHGVGLVSRDGSGYQGGQLESRVCRLAWRVQEWVKHAPATPSSVQPSKYGLYFLLGYFLYQGNLINDGGVARWFIKGSVGMKLDVYEYEKLTIAQVIKNIESATPRSLAVAYLFIGCAFGLISRDDLSLLRRAFDFTGYLFPRDREEVKGLAQCFQKYHLDAIWEIALENLHIDDLVKLAWLLRDR